VNRKSNEMELSKTQIQEQIFTRRRRSRGEKREQRENATTIGVEERSTRPGRAAHPLISGMEFVHYSPIECAGSSLRTASNLKPRPGPSPPLAPPPQLGLKN
jgi:hypothetical protein